MSQNELFQIKVDDGKVLLRVPPALKGKPATLDRIQAQLFELDVDYVPEKLLDIFQEASNKYEELCDLVRKDYEILVDVSEDKMEAYVTIIPPTVDEEGLYLKKIEHALINEGVTRGIRYDYLQDVIDEKIENEPVLAARGKKPVHGQEGTLEFPFQKKKEEAFNPLHMDLRETHLLSAIKAGDVLAQINMPSKGEHGYLVTGETLPCRLGKPIKLRPGAHARFNNDRTQILAERDGYVLVGENRVSVERIYEVEHVNSKTGNIRFDGILIVRGNVEDAYTVEASSRIEVLGSVGKSTLSTQGSIKVNNGVLGSVLRAGGTISAGFVSDANVISGQDVVVRDYILNSNVTARDIVYVLPGSGFITGGTTQAGIFVKCPNLGSGKTEVQTLVEVGMDADRRREFYRVDKSLQQGMSNFEKLKKNLLILQMAREKRGSLPEEHENLFHTMIEGIEGFREKVFQEVQTWRKLSETINRSVDINGGIVFVEDVASPGAIIRIDQIGFTVGSQLKHAAFSLVNDRIRTQDLDALFGPYKRQFMKLYKASPRKVLKAKKGEDDSGGN